MTERVKVFVSVPSLGEVSDYLMFMLRGFDDKYKDTIQLVYPPRLVNKIFHDAARNTQVEMFLASDCDIMWCIDSDVVPPYDVLDIVTKYGDMWKCAGAPYPIFMAPKPKADPAAPSKPEEEPQIVWCVYDKGLKGLVPARVPLKGEGFVDGMATGCIFLRREVFDKLEKPYFEFKYDEKTRQIMEGEDLNFCKKLNALGYKFFVDYSKVCRHYKKIDLLDVNNYAIEMTNTALKTYSENTKHNVEALVKRFKDKESSQSKIIIPRLIGIPSSG